LIRQKVTERDTNRVRQTDRAQSRQS